jgi:pyruvate kinase
MIRRTKVVATLGPASSDAKTLTRMIEAGLDVVRINFSHGAPDEHRARVNLVRQLARKAGRAVGVLVDLQGPKIRVGKFKDGKITLEPGAKFVLDAECKLGDQHVVGLDYKNLPNDVHPGDTLLLDDGRIVLGVTGVRGPKISTVVEQGGPLSNNKGINRKGGGLTAPALTEKDKQDIKLAAELKADFLAVSFPRSGEDVRWARDLFNKAGGHGLIVSKIERAEAIPALEEILDASDAIMVARGDLAVEVGDAAKTHDPHGALQAEADHHCDANDGVDDQQPDSDACGGFGRCQCGAGRHRCGDDLRRNGSRQISGRNHRRDGAGLRRGGKGRPAAAGAAWRTGTD